MENIRKMHSRLASRWRRDGLIEYVILLGLFSSIVLPPVGAGEFVIYLNSPFSIIVLACVVTRWLEGCPIIVHRSVVFPLLMVFMVFCSSILSWGTGLSEPDKGDLLESFKYGQFIPYLLAIPYMRFESFERKFLVLFLVAFWIFLAVCLGQSIPSLGVVEIIATTYLGADSVHLESALSGYRLTLTGGDPNIGAAIAFFFAFVFFSLGDQYGKSRYILIGLVVSFFGMLTQSRTSMVALLVSVFGYLSFRSRASITIKVFMFVLLAGFLGIVVQMMGSEYVTEGWVLFSLGENESLNIRLSNYTFAFDRFLESPLLGYGPAKSHMDRVIDAEYALIVQRYGIVGVLVFFGYLCYLFKLSSRAIVFLSGKVTFLFLSFSLILMATNNVFSGYQLMSLVIVLHILCVLTLRDCVYGK